MQAIERTGSAATRPRTDVFLAAPGTQILDVAGPFQVFVRASEPFVRQGPARTPPYCVRLASSTRQRSVATDCGLVFAGTETCRTLRGLIDTLLRTIPGTEETCSNAPLPSASPPRRLPWRRPARASPVSPLPERRQTTVSTPARTRSVR